MNRPVVGITPDLSEAMEGAAPRYELKVAYADAVLRAGGLPWVLSYADSDSVCGEYLDRLSALVVTGGAFDIPPEAYGEAAREGLGALKLGRTRFETAMLSEALRRRLPVLGVCGGMQLLNVVRGGTLIQDIGREIPGASEHEQKHDRGQPHHPVEVKAGSLLEGCVGRGQLMVNSTHHQAVKGVAPGLRVSATALDGVIEAIESIDPSGDNFVLGVQWHPELLLDSVPAHGEIYVRLVQAAAGRAR